MHVRPSEKAIEIDSRTFIVPNFDAPPGEAYLAWSAHETRNGFPFPVGPYRATPDEARADAAELRAKDRPGVHIRFEQSMDEIKPGDSGFPLNVPFTEADLVAVPFIGDANVNEVAA